MKENKAGIRGSPCSPLPAWVAVCDDSVIKNKQKGGYQFIDIDGYCIKRSDAINGDDGEVEYLFGCRSEGVYH